MAAAADLLLMTVDEYRLLPERDDEILELHWGEVVSLSRPKIRHVGLQYRMADLMRPMAQSLGVLGVEMPFRAVPEYDLRAADVAFVSQARWDEAMRVDGDLRGSPELVIEVLSPSNTKAKIRAMAALCLGTGSEEFWVVDPKAKTIAVMRRNGESVVYGIDGRIPLAMFGTHLDVSLIFT
jgi:Uma2 family endonuclease